MHRPDISSLMFAGCVGAYYRPNIDPLLIAINPGGGDDSGLTPIDDIFCSLLRQFRNAAPERVLECWERVNAASLPTFRTWNLWKIIKPTLEAVNRPFDHVAFLNAVPYRTRGNKMPPVRARTLAWDLLAEPTIDLLAPREIIALGKKAGVDVLDRLYVGQCRRTTLPRTNGDSYLRHDALAALADLRMRWAGGR